MQKSVIVLKQVFVLNQIQYFCNYKITYMRFDNIQMDINYLKALTTWFVMATRIHALLCNHLK